MEINASIQNNQDALAVRVAAQLEAAILNLLSTSSKMPWPLIAASASGV